MMECNVKANSFKAWVFAARPKTLAAASVPVIIGSALAVGDGKFSFVPFALCLLFAFIMQVAANFINDLYDYRKGSDREDRLGPERACAQGWITPGAMLRGIFAAVVLACVCGVWLVLYGGWWLVGVGAVCVAVPVCCTYYVQAGDVTPAVLAASLASGLVIDTLLVINNFRDIEADRKSGKKTIIVRFGYAFGLYLYLFLGIAAVLLCMAFLCDGHLAAALLPLLYLPPHFMAWRSMKKIGRGRELNAVLGKTSRNMLLFALLILAGFMV